jgi:UDP-glucose 4-epimerase
MSIGRIDGRRILVTGGAGFVGSHLVEKLAASNEVAVLDNLHYGRRENLSGLRCTLIEDDVRTADIAGLLRARGINLVFHLAAFHLADSLTDPWADFTTSALGGMRVLEACRQAGVSRLVYASTGSVYGEPSHALHDEDHALVPTTPYGNSKAAIDHYCRIYRNLYGLETVRLRYYNIYGPRRTAGAIPQFILKALKGDPIRIEGGDQIRTPTFVTDIVEATLLAAMVPEAAGEAFNLAASTAISISEMARIIVRLCGTEDRVRFEGAPYRPGEIMDLRPDVTRARRVLGWEARIPFEEGVQRLIPELRAKTGPA